MEGMGRTIITSLKKESIDFSFYPLYPIYPC